jgi:hypothetical protein
MLNRIPEKYYEIAGTGFGLLASVSIATQIYAEYSTDTPSTVSPLYLSGFLVIFMFWTIYGLRFKRAALWLTNGIAVVMQALLLLVILLK